MTKPVYHGHQRFYELIEEVQELHSRKNADYAKGTDPLSNFRACTAFGIPAWKGVLVRMSDKWSRIIELANGKKPEVSDEGIMDTLKDLSVYSLLTIILLEELEHDSGD